MTKLQDQMDATNKNDASPNGKSENNTNAESESIADQLFPELHTQKAIIQDLVNRVGQLEQSQASSLAFLATHRIAQELLRRLGNGDKLDPVVQRQLRVSLSVQDQTLLTPGLTGSVRAESTVSTAATDDARTSRAFNTQTKRKAVASVEEAPPFKRPRGRPPKNRLSHSSVEHPESKRLRGRPPTSKTATRKISDGSVSSSSSVLSYSSTEDASGVAMPKKQPTAEKIVSNVIEKRDVFRKEQSDPVHIEGAQREISSDSDIVDSDESTVQKDITKERPADSIEDESDAHARTVSKALLSRSRGRSKRETISTRSVGASPGCDTHKSKPESRLTKAVASPGKLPSTVSIAATEQSRIMATPNNKRPRHERDSDAVSQDNAPTSPAYRNIGTPDLAAMETSTADGLPIPGERQSARKRKAPKMFGDMISWKEVNEQVHRLRPSAP